MGKDAYGCRHDLLSPLRRLDVFGLNAADWPGIVDQFVRHDPATGLMQADRHRVAVRGVWHPIRG